MDWNTGVLISATSQSCCGRSGVILPVGLLQEIYSFLRTKSTWTFIISQKVYFTVSFSQSNYLHCSSKAWKPELNTHVWYGGKGSMVCTFLKLTLTWMAASCPEGHPFSILPRWLETLLCWVSTWFSVGGCCSCCSVSRGKSDLYLGCSILQYISI